MTSTREQILDAAGRLIHIRGFNNTSVDDILRESGVGKGNFYYYFKSKDELGFAILDRNVDRIREELVERHFVPTADPWDQLLGFVEFPVERARKQGCIGGCPLGNLAVELSDIHEEFRKRLTKAFDELRTQIERSLAHAKTEGTLRPEADIPRLSHFIIAGIEGAFMLGKLSKDPEVVAGVIEELKEHLTHYRLALAPMAHG